MSDDLKVLDSRIYNQDKYEYTEIESIEIDKDHHITLRGDKKDDADGYYYFTHIRFVVDKNLDFLKDQSDSEPYHSYYRGSSASDYTDDEEGEGEMDNAEQVQQVDTAEENTNPILTENTEKKTEKLFYTGDVSRKTYYSLAYNEENITDVVFKKINQADSTFILKRTFLPGKGYSPKMVYETPDGGFVVAFNWRHKVGSGEYYHRNAFESKVLLFRFNKQGNLSHQYESSLYTGVVTDFYLSGTRDKLIAAFMISNSYFDGDWHYPGQLRIAAFPL